jgi:hypothetical protein
MCSLSWLIFAKPKISNVKDQFADNGQLLLKF